MTAVLERPEAVTILGYPRGAYWHYTCDHGHRDIGDAGELLPVLTQRPQLAAFLGATSWLFRLVWATDLDQPHGDALGLTRISINCDRSRHRYRITDPTPLVPWLEYARGLTQLQRASLEHIPGVKPDRWYVATAPVPVVYAPLEADR